MVQKLFDPVRKSDPKSGPKIRSVEKWTENSFADHADFWTGIRDSGTDHVMEQT